MKILKLITEKITIYESDYTKGNCCFCKSKRSYNRKIGHGLLLLVGYEKEDTLEDISWVVHKIINMRIFNDGSNKMNLSLKELNGDILLISQFTLFASTKKGNRPSFMNSAPPKIAEKWYENTIQEFEKLLEKDIQTGKFGAMMDVSIQNNGPVTLFIDSKNKE